MKAKTGQGYVWQEHRKMRILWVVASERPFKEANAWEYLDQFAIESHRVDSIAAADDLLAASDYNIIILDTAVADSINYLEKLRGIAQFSKTPVMLISETWGKKEFKSHAQEHTPAENYARSPLPVKGFIKVACQLLDISVAQLKAGEVPTPGQDSEVSARLDSLASAAEEIVAPPEAELLQNDEPPPEIEFAMPVSEEKASSGSLLDKIRKSLTGKPESEESAVDQLLSGVTPSESNEIDPAPVYESQAPVFKSTKASPEDVEALRNYLDMREQELAIKTSELEHMRLHAQNLQKELKEVNARMRDVEHLKNESMQRLTESEQLTAKLCQDAEDNRLESERIEQQLNAKVRETNDRLSKSDIRYKNLKNRVKRDILKIQAREKELELRLELVKKDSSALLDERDKQVLELNRKIDALEFDIDQLQDGRVKAQYKANQYIDKLSRLGRTLQVAVGMIEVKDEEEESADEDVELGGSAAKKFEESQASETAKSDEASELLAGVEDDSGPLLEDAEEAELENVVDEDGDLGIDDSDLRLG